VETKAAHSKSHCHILKERDGGKLTPRERSIALVLYDEGGAIPGAKGVEWEKRRNARGRGEFHYQNEVGPRTTQGREGSWDELGCRQHEPVSEQDTESGGRERKSQTKGREGEMEAETYTRISAGEGVQGQATASTSTRRKGEGGEVRRSFMDKKTWAVRMQTLKEKRFAVEKKTRFFWLEEEAKRKRRVEPPGKTRVAREEKANWGIPHDWPEAKSRLREEEGPT